MPLDFPSNPTNGQVYQDYYYDATLGVWNSLGNSDIPNILSNGTFTASSGTTVPLTVSGASGQSANLQEWKSQAGATLASISANGGLSLNAPLSVQNGGTGVNTLTLNGYLKGNGSSGITSQSGIPGGDITSGTVNRLRLPTANWVVSNATAAITVNTTTPTTIISLSITTRGNPVYLCATGDMNPTTAPPNWNWMKLYRDSTAIGQTMICESTGNSVNNPFALTFIDSPAAGTYTYSVRAWQGAGTQVYGENGAGQAPQLVAFELF
jgi:hypothetical protein